MERWQLTTPNKNHANCNIHKEFSWRINVELTALIIARKYARAQQIIIEEKLINSQYFCLLFIMNFNRRNVNELNKLLKQYAQWILHTDKKIKCHECLNKHRYIYLMYKIAVCILTRSPDIDVSVPNNQTSYTLVRFALTIYQIAIESSAKTVSSKALNSYRILKAFRLVRRELLVEKVISETKNNLNQKQQNLLAEDYIHNILVEVARLKTISYKMKFKFILQSIIFQKKIHQYHFVFFLI